MPIVYITKGMGEEPADSEFTGEYFDTDEAQGHKAPPKDRQGLSLWKTKLGAYVLMQGTVNRLAGRRAVILSTPRAAAIMHSWGHALPPELQNQAIEI